MSRLHVNIRVADLARAVDYYTTFWGQAPLKRRGDYAKWSLDDPAVNFAITVADERHPAGVEHLGVEVGAQEELSGALQRAESAGELDVEGRVVCCYAESTKGWARDPAGVSWELFLTHADRDERGGGGEGGRNAICCTPPPTTATPAKTTAEDSTPCC